MSMQPNERAATSLRLEGPGLGLGLDPEEVSTYMDAVTSGLIIPETRCDKGMQDNYALRAETTVALALRCPKLSGQGSNRILIWKGTGSSAGEAKTIHSRV
jgi:hypothetical protein